MVLAALAAVVTAGPAGAAPSKKDEPPRSPAGTADAPAAPATSSAAEHKRWHAQLRKRIRKRPPALINVYNTWTHEYLVVDAGRGGALPPPELVNRFLRCHFTNNHVEMAGALFRTMLAAANQFKARRVDVVSGFRAPKYNLLLRKKGRRVARDSQHTHGHAVDFRLPGVSTERLRDWARRRRLGGVGYYQNDGFVHVDVGPVRYWAE
jgi:uncharacterized protein YcbK (DUF882 family)